MAVEVDIVEAPVLVISFVRQRLVVLTREKVILSSRVSSVLLKLAQVVEMGILSYYI